MWKVNISITIRITSQNSGTVKELNGRMFINIFKKSKKKKLVTFNLMTRIYLKSHLKTGCETLSVIKILINYYLYSPPPAGYFWVRQRAWKFDACVWYDELNRALRVHGLGIIFTISDNFSFKRTCNINCQ